MRRVVKRRKCSKCREKKPFSGFYKTRGILNTVCKECVKARTRQYHLDNKVVFNEWRYWYRVEREYGVTKQQAIKKFKKQKGKCAICDKTLDPMPCRGTHIDHCHKTGEFRGILCNHCNKGLSGFLDSTTSLLAAVEYLDGHRKI